jgi:hypothetical protein
MDKTRWARALGLMLLGAIGFWVPDVFLHAVHAHNFNSRDVRIITMVTPLTLLGTFVAAKWATKGARTGRIGLPMIAGVWLLGGLFMTVGASFSGGGFMGPEGSRGAVLMMLLSLFPMYTFIMATYDGSLGALLLVTVVALLVWIFQRSKILTRFGIQSGTPS